MIETKSAISKMMDNLIAIGKVRLADVKRHGVRTFLDLLEMLHVEHCNGCAGNVSTCALAEAAEKSKWNDNEFCPRCFGRMVGIDEVEKDGVKNNVKRYGESGLVLALLPSGRHFTALRCDCVPARMEFPNMKAAPLKMREICALRRIEREAALRMKMLNRVQRMREP